MSSMSAAVLYLDVDYRPLRVEHWTRAIADVFTGKTEVVEYSRDRTIRGVAKTYPMPAVVRVLKRFKRERIRVKFSRLNIYARDGFVCQYDGRRYPTEDLTFDHVLPRSRGGRTNWENIVTCCVECNAAKADRTPAEAGMRLLRAPRKPHALPSVMVTMDSTRMPPEWGSYWTTTLDS